MLIHLFAKGGPIMYALLACSILGLYISIQKYLYLKVNQESESDVLETAKQSLRQHGAQQTIRYLNQNKTLSSRLLVVILSWIDASKETAAVHIENESKKLAHKLSSQMELLSTIITASPILGLLGTIIGLIDIFKVISGGGIGDPEVLSAGIATALITTVTGLSITIPFMFIHHYLSGRIQDKLLSLEVLANDFIVFCQDKSGE